jgi:hypothetical protein
MSHDVTMYGLHRMAVELVEGYPDVATWMQMLEPTAKVIVHWYEERIVQEGSFVVTLHIFWKD